MYRGYILDLIRTFEASDLDREIKQDIWNRFIHYYLSISQDGFLIRFPNFWYKAQGIIAPRQLLAWRKLIEIISEKVFNEIHLSLNYNAEEKNIFFLEEYGKHFPNSENLKIVFTCGYFWKFVERSNRREQMKDFFKDKAEKGCEVKIYTQDKTLKSEFAGNKSYVKSRPYRMDIHSTIVEPKNKKDWDRTLIFTELPHTERTNYRLEAFFTIAQLKSLGCSEKQIKKLLAFLKGQQSWFPHLLIRSLPSKLNLALNWRALAR
jgi:hypothetical protein